ncbi:MAG: nuclear transport factor 2 family protein [Rhodanobacter sp.]
MQTTTLFAMASVLAVLILPLMAAEMPKSAAACSQPAFEAGDADAVTTCCARAAVLWLPGVPMMRGRDAIRAGYTGFFAAAMIKSVTLVELVRFAHGNEMTSWGSFTVVSVLKKDGKESIEHGRCTDVSRKIDGCWVYLVDHASDDPEATATH